MKEMILNNAKIEKELYIVQDLLQDSKPMTSWNMRGTVLKMQKMCWIAVILCISAIQPAYADRNHAPSLTSVRLEEQTG